MSGGMKVSAPDGVKVSLSRLRKRALDGRRRRARALSLAFRRPPPNANACPPINTKIKTTGLPRHERQDLRLLAPRGQAPRPPQGRQLPPPPRAAAGLWLPRRLPAHEVDARRAVPDRHGVSPAAGETRMRWMFEKRSAGWRRNVQTLPSDAALQRRCSGAAKKEEEAGWGEEETSTDNVLTCLILLRARASYPRASEERNDAEPPLPPVFAAALFFFFLLRSRDTLQKAPPPPFPNDEQNHHHPTPPKIQNRSASTTSPTSPSSSTATLTPRSSIFSR